MTHVLIRDRRRGQRDTQVEKPCEERERDWSDAAPYLEPLEAGQARGDGPPEPLEAMWP